MREPIQLESLNFLERLVQSGGEVVKREFNKVDSPFWLDANGRIQKTPTGNKLHFCKIPLHAALRAFVYTRDRFTCQMCGTKPAVIPVDFDGRDSPFVQRFAKSGYQSYLVIDHILSRRNGGTNHPANLQALCDCCNSAKSGLVDAKYRGPDGTHPNR